MLRDLQPEKFVDVDTWQVREFETPSEKLMGETLPRAAQAAGWALRAGALLLAASSSSVLVLGGITGFAAWRYMAWERKGYDKFVDSIWDSKYISDNRVYEPFDVGNPAQAAKLSKIMGASHAQFVDEYKKICATAGFNTPPRIVIVGDKVKVWSKKNPSDVAVRVESKQQDDYIFGAATKADGSKPIVMIGDRVPEQMTPAAMRAIIGHELTHLALEHTRKNGQMGIFAGGLAFAAFTVAAAAISFSAPLFAVAGLATGLIAFDSYAGSVVSRYNENVCDRGGALLTGETGELASGLKKLGMKMQQAKRLEDKIYKDRPKTLWEAYGKPVRKWWRNTELGKIINDSHPEDEVREQLLTGYRQDTEDRHYLSWRAQQFRGAFLKAAVRPDAAAAVAQAPARAAQSLAKSGIEA